jgi:hypothetical protein
MQKRRDTISLPDEPQNRTSDILVIGLVFMALLYFGYGLIDCFWR